MRVLNQSFDQPQKTEESAASPLAGGIMQYGYQCGMIWGATLAAGAQAYRLVGPGPQSEAVAIRAAQRLVESFRANNKHINCLEITDIDRTSSTLQMIMFFLIKGGTIGCMRMAAKYAKVARNEIDSALSETAFEAPSPPVSCSAMLARMMGQSEMHAVMAAGLAGGIGLCGGACGALGTAIWISGVNGPESRTKGGGFKDPALHEMIDRFLKCTDYKFECSEIAGRKFENVEEHAAYLRGGGCSKILEALAVK